MTVVLHRSIAARLFSGFWLQRILTPLVALSLVSIGFLLTLPGVPVVQAGLAALAEVPPLAVWAFGVTAWARADEDGMHWRYFRRHDVAWDEAELIRYGTVITGTPGLPKRAAVFVRRGGVEHPVVPAYDVPRAALSEFADGLAAMAARHRVPAAADSRLWDRYALPGAVREPSRAPGRVVSRSLRRLRMRLTGVAFIVVAACALLGTITGYEAPGVGERIAFGVIGVLLLLVGVLLTLVPGG